MATHNLLLLPGDGIGPEVMAEVKRVIDFFNKGGPDRSQLKRRWWADAVTTRIRWPSQMPQWKKPKRRTP